MVGAEGEKWTGIERGRHSGRQSVGKEDEEERNDSERDKLERQRAGNPRPQALKDVVRTRLGDGEVLLVWVVHEQENNGIDEARVATLNQAIKR